MKKILFVMLCCLCLCGCNKEETTVTVCVRSYQFINASSIEMYNAVGNNITSYSLGFVHSFSNEEDANEKRNELLNANSVYQENENLIEVIGTNVYEWSLKDVEYSGILKDKIQELNNDNYECETKTIG